MSASPHCCILYLLASLHYYLPFCHACMEHVPVLCLDGLRAITRLTDYSLLALRDTLLAAHLPVPTAATTCATTPCYLPLLLPALHTTYYLQCWAHYTTHHPTPPLCHVVPGRAGMGVKQHWRCKRTLYSCLNKPPAPRFMAYSFTGIADDIAAEADMVAPASRLH